MSAKAHGSRPGLQIRKFQEIVKTQRTAAVISILLALGLAPAAHAQEKGTTSGFYGGVSMRDHANESAGITLGPASSVWSRFVTPTADDSASRALIFGGYRFRNDIAVEASFNTLDQYALRPDNAGGRRGVGLNLGSNSGIGELATRSWNVDVYTSWTFYRSLALYGRVGYAQSESVPVFGATPIYADGRRQRDGVNVGVGLRYDMNSSLGLRVEYARFGRFAGEIGATFPDTDQVSVGLQMRF
jgi:opacity protein-like surface antigen